MPEQLFIARQPILDSDQNIFGYEFFYRDQQGNSGADNPRHATSSVLANLLNQIGLEKSIGGHKAFINIDAEILETEILYTLPNDIFIFELSEAMQITAKEVDAIAALHRGGYEFALDNSSYIKTYYKNFHAVFDYISYVKFDATQTDIEHLELQVKLFRKFKLIAQKVEFYEIFEVYRDMGFDYFQGFFFAEPHLIQQNRIDPKHLDVINIFNMLQNDASMDIIADAFQEHSELSMQLLQYLKSTAAHKAGESSSIREILEKMGPQKLKQWLMMIVYAKSGQNPQRDDSPHSLLIKKRVDTMLELLNTLYPAKYEEMAEQVRFLAFMSLLEPVFNVPLSSILETFDVNTAIKEALLSRAGELGGLYALALSIERSDFAKTQTLLRRYRLSINHIAPIIKKSLFLT